MRNLRMTASFALLLSSWLKLCQNAANFLHLQKCPLNVKLYRLSDPK